MIELSAEERRMAMEHRDALLNVRAILTTAEGKGFFKYLFKTFDVNELPEVGMEGTFLADRLGFLRAGNSIFKLVAEADAHQAGELLAVVEKERYVDLQNAQNGRS
jgi:hypothetical protein